MCPGFRGVGRLDSHATVGAFSNGIGVSMPRLLWRGCRLWKTSRYPGDRVGQLDPGLPAAPVKQLHLHPRPERLHHRVVVAGPHASHPGQQPESVARRVNAHEANSHALVAVWMIAPAGGVRVWIAIPSALVTSAAVGQASMEGADHPAGERIQHDRAVGLAWRVGCSVRSVTHNWSRPLRKN